MSKTTADEKLEKREFWAWAEEARKDKYPRLDYLRKAVWNKSTKGSNWLPGIKADITRQRIYTRVDQELVSEPIAIRRAECFKAYLTESPIFIIDHSQIVGYCASAPHMVHWVMEATYSYNADIFNDRSGVLADEDRDEAEKYLEYWKPRCMQTAIERHLTPRERINSMMAITSFGNAHNDSSDYSMPTPEWWLDRGFNAIIKELDEKINATAAAVREIPHKREAFFEIPKIDNWKAMKTALEGAIIWAKRYSRLARIIAENFETDEKRKKELLAMAEVCEHVPANAPRNIHESIQFFHFFSMCDRIEYGNLTWPNHPDQWQYKYYRMSVDNNIHTRDQIIEFLGEWQMRVYEHGRLWSRVWRETLQGSPGPFSWTLGGQTEDGKDACNELTELILEAARLTRVTDPTYTFRYFDPPESTIRQIYECIRHGLGYPNLRNDEVLVENEMYWFGHPKEEARRWAVNACMSPGVPTKYGSQPQRYANGTLVVAKALELAFFNGWDPISKMQVGPKTGDPLTFTDFEQFYEAQLKQLEYMQFESLRIWNIYRTMVSNIRPVPFRSACYERAVENGYDACDATHNPERGNAWLTYFAFNEHGDVLAGLKKLVYDDKKYTMQQLLDALKANWEGYEEMRMDFVRAPKWGNDDDYADQMFVRINADSAKLAWKCKEVASGSPHPSLPQNAAAHVVCGSKVGALPNGRKLGDIMYDGGCSPGSGLDKKGPTAVLRSVAKLDHVKHFKSSLLNQRLDPAQISGEKGFNLFHSYLKTWKDLKINHVQFNCIDNETLRAAQKEPEKFPELIVRVAGYSAIFVALNKKAQDNIISRRVQTLTS